MPSLTGLPQFWLTVVIVANAAAWIGYIFLEPIWRKYRTQKMAEKKQQHDESAAAAQFASDRSDKVYQYVIDQLTKQTEELKTSIDRINAERMAERTEYNAKLVSLNNDHMECVRSQAALKAQNELLIAEQLRLRESNEVLNGKLEALQVHVDRLYQHDKANKENVEVLKKAVEERGG